MYEYIKQQIKNNNMINKMSKKQFIRDLHLKCNIPIGPLNILFNNIPDDNNQNQNEIIEFISNYLYQLRINNIERIGDRCIKSNIKEQTFIKTYKNDNKIKKLIPKIQQYAQNLYPNMNIIRNENEQKQNINNTQTFGIWLSQLCYERSKLTKQQQIIVNYIKENNITTLYHL